MLDPRLESLLISMIHTETFELRAVPDSRVEVTLLRMLCTEKSFEMQAMLDSRVGPALLGALCTEKVFDLQASLEHRLEVLSFRAPTIGSRGVALLFDAFCIEKKSTRKLC